MTSYTDKIYGGEIKEVKLRRIKLTGRQLEVLKTYQPDALDPPAVFFATAVKDVFQHKPGNKIVSDLIYSMDLITGIIETQSFYYQVQLGVKIYPDVVMIQDLVIPVNCL